MPCPPAGECTCAASPARKTRPTRYAGACRSSLWNRDIHRGSCMPKPEPSARRVTSRISSRSSASSSNFSADRFQAKMRYHPSPNGATKANASPTPLTASTSSGGSVSRTSASIIERKTDVPGNGSPRACRTELLCPSAPTTYCACNPDSPSARRTRRSTPPPSCSAPTTSAPRTSRAPFCTARCSSRRSTWYCGVTSRYGNRLGRVERSSRTRANNRSRCTWAPVPASAPARPRVSSISIVRACTPKARVRFESSVRRSSTVVCTPSAARSPASSKPVGPAPTIATSVLSVLVSTTTSPSVPTAVGQRSLATIGSATRHVNARWHTVVGMPSETPPRRSDATRSTILQAARERFAADGYDRATIRAIAADAGIDPSMVMRYYGSKEKLFGIAAEFDLRLPDLSALPRAEVGSTLARHLITVWEADETFLALLRAAVTNDVAATRMGEVFREQVAPTLTAVVSEPASAPTRAGLVVSQVLGMALTRYALRLPPLVAMSADDVVAWLGPTLQRYLTAPVPT